MTFNAVSSGSVENSIGFLALLGDHEVLHGPDRSHVLSVKAMDTQRASLHKCNAGCQCLGKRPCRQVASNTPLTVQRVPIMWLLSLSQTSLPFQRAPIAWLWCWKHSWITFVSGAVFAPVRVTHQRHRHVDQTPGSPSSLEGPQLYLMFGLGRGQGGWGICDQDVQTLPVP